MDFLEVPFKVLGTPKTLKMRFPKFPWVGR
jgi:hypothetical protein